MSQELFKEEFLFDKLYGLDKSNKIKEWTIKVINMTTYSLVIYTYGLLTGKKTECKLTISCGKNIGKKNQTTHYQQAILEAKSKWNKKKDIDNYIVNLDELKKNVTKNLNSGNIESSKKPMLAQEFKKHEHKIQYPCYIQPKLDGYRMIYDHILKTCLTRTGKIYNIILKTSLFEELKKIPYSLDGELYVHDPEFKFEKYGVLRKQKSLNEKEITTLDQIEFHVYDIVNEGEIYENRLKMLKEIFDKNIYNLSKIKFVETKLCNSKEEILENHKINTQNNYEGSMIRNIRGMYKCKFRSFDLLKYKDFDDAEFEIVNYTYEKDVTGNDKNLIVWVCKTPQNKEFHVQSKGTREERHELYKNASKYIGKKLWVQYFGLTNDLIPRFPKTLREGKLSIREETC
jgi:DNA ligase-1